MRLKDAMRMNPIDPLGTFEAARNALAEDLAILGPRIVRRHKAERIIGRRDLDQLKLRIAEFEEALEAYRATEGRSPEIPRGFGGANL